MGFCRGFAAVVSALAVAVPLIAHAAELPSCRTIRIASLGWADNEALDGVFDAIAKGLGYQVKVESLQLPAILEGLKAKRLDLFLDNWLPTNAAALQPYLDAKSIEQLSPNVAGMGYGPAVPDYVAAAGVRDIADLAANAERFGRRIYAVEVDSAADALLQKRIDDPASGLRGWTIMAASEQGMIGQVQALIAQQKWVVLLGWRPQPVMNKMPLVFLTGFEKDGFGAAEVTPLIRAGYRDECPNLARLLANLQFSPEMESMVMSDSTSVDSDGAGANWLTAHPDVLAPWLAGVTVFDGSDGLAAVRKSLGISAP